jgi:hypothetical protein
MLAGALRPAPPCRAEAATRRRRIAWLTRDARSFSPGGFAPPVPPTRSLAGAPGPAPLAWLTRCSFACLFSFPSKIRATELPREAASSIRGDLLEFQRVGLPTMVSKPEQARSTELSIYSESDDKKEDRESLHLLGERQHQPAHPGRQRGRSTPFVASNAGATKTSLSMPGRNVR